MAQGERFAVRAETGFNQLSLRLGKGAGDWFQAKGELQVDQDLVLELGNLLKRLDQGSGTVCAPG